MLQQTHIKARKAILYYSKVEGIVYCSPPTRIHDVCYEHGATLNSLHQVTFEKCTSLPHARQSSDATNVSYAVDFVLLPAQYPYPKTIYNNIFFFRKYNCEETSSSLLRRQEKPITTCIRLAPFWSSS